MAALEELNQASGGRLRVIPADAMKIDERAEAGDGAHIASNLPYNVGTALFVRWMTLDSWPPWWRSLTLMFQKEVAERIVAKPGTGAYGRLAVLAQWRAKPAVAMNVHRSAFVPPPKVMSAVIHVVPGEQPDGISMAMIEALTAAAFGQRRKMLRQSLKSVVGAVETLTAVGIDPERRAETLSVDEFVALGRALQSSI
jgi:16S rRNA (adenine1518-N6/adenine1519-N6)-dimethyltransferase